MSALLNDPPRCQYCGNYHNAKCPLVKSIEYENGTVKRVEFFSALEVPYSLKLREAKND